MYRVGRCDSQLSAGAVGVRAFVQPGGGFGDHGLCGDRAACEDSPRDYRQERLCSGGRGDRIRPRTRSAALLRHRLGPGRDPEGAQAGKIGAVGVLPSPLSPLIAMSSPQSSAQLDHAESPAIVRSGLSRGVAPPGARAGAAKESDFPLARGISQSAALELGLRDRLIYWGMVAVIHALSILPDFFLYPLGVAGGWLAYHLDQRHARIGIGNLEIAFPERSDSERRRILRGSYMNLGRTAAEYITLGGFFYRRLARRVTYHRVDIL